jgi:phosphoglycolate phosphatase-like HAD superfamily hydrolase
MNILSKRTSKKFISLDMDETLLHTYPAYLCRNFKKQPTGVIRFESEYNVYLRPGVHDMLMALQDMGELNVLTKGTCDYAEQALKLTNLYHFFPRIFAREDIHDHGMAMSNNEVAKLGV